MRLLIHVTGMYVVRTNFSKLGQQSRGEKSRGSPVPREKKKTEEPKIQAKTNTRENKYQVLGTFVSEEGINKEIDRT